MPRRPQPLRIAIDTGGTFTDCVWAEHGQIRIAAVHSDGFAEVSVSDTGIGIPHEEHTTIFDAFHQVGATTKGIREGTGLGLPLAKKFVELHGGTIWVESTLGHGSTFTFTLPVVGTASHVPLPTVQEDTTRDRERAVEHIRRVGDAARAAGVRRVVYNTTSWHPDRPIGVPSLDRLLEKVEALRATKKKHDRHPESVSPRSPLARLPLANIKTRSRTSARTAPRSRRGSLRPPY